MTGNNARYDLSDRLIHFFRAVDPSHPDTPLLPEHWSFASVEVWDEPLSPFFMMRNAVRQGRLWATWSVRNKKRTIYGPDPAVCFTDMPIAAFVEAGASRAARGEAMSSYALVFPKRAMFAQGTRPVIYALSGDASVSQGDGGERLIAPHQLPTAEQYRYVTYDPAAQYPIDWSHEREWRWPLRNAEAPAADNDGLPPDIDDLNGLELDQPSLHGMGAIVKTTEQAERLVYDILTKIDRGDIDEHQYDFVLALDAIGDLTLLRDRMALGAAIDAAGIDLSSFFQTRAADARQVERDMHRLVEEVEAETGAIEWGEHGGCWLWITDTTHEITRALLHAGAITVTKTGKYLFRPDGFSDERGGEQRKGMTLALAARLQQRFGLSATYLFVLGKDDPDDPAFFNGDQLDNHKFYNHSNNDGDY